MNQLSDKDAGSGNNRGTLRLLRKLVITLMGVTIVLIGLVLLVLPGPGILVAALGLALLGLEYSWAKRLSDRLRETAGKIVKRKNGGESGGR